MVITMAIEKEKKTTTITIDVKTKRALDELGDKGDTYDDIIRRLILSFKKQSKENEDLI